MAILLLISGTGCATGCLLSSDGLVGNEKSTGRNLPCSPRFVDGFTLSCLIRPFCIPTNYWRGLNPPAPAQGGAATIPAGLKRITPDWSEQKARWPDWPSATGVAVDSNVTAGTAIVRTTLGTAVMV